MKTVIRIAIKTYIAYLALAILLVNPALNILAPKIVRDNFGRELSTDIIFFNPFSLNLEVRGASLPEKNGEPFASLEHAAINLSVESLWQTGWVLDEVAIEELDVHVRRLPSEDFNFSDMIPPQEDTPSPAEEDTGIPGVTIHDFSFGARRIALSDEARDEPFHTHYDGLSIAVQDLSTVFEEGRPYQLSAVAEAGGRLNWEGTVSVPRGESAGRLSLQNISLATVWRFAQPWVAFELKSGKMNLQGQYTINWLNELDYSISDGKLGISALDIVPASTATLADTSVQLADFTVNGIVVNGAKQHAGVDATRLDGLAISGWSEGSEVSLQQLFDMSGLPASEADDTASGADPNKPGWTASIANTTLQNSSVRWRSEFTDPPLLEVTPLEASISNLNWPLDGSSALALKLAVNQVAGLDISGDIALASGEGTLDYDLSDLPLPWFSPNLPKALKAKLTGGAVAVNGKLELAGFTPTRVHMEGVITDFAGQIEGEETSLTSWETVRWEELSVDLEQRKVAMKLLTIDDYAGRLHIAKDGSVNALNVWEEEVGEQAEELAEDLELDKPWQVSVPAIYINDSQIDFMDESLPIPFRTVMGDLEGAILNISTDSDKVTSVDIKGSVDGYAPVTLKGTAQPLAAPPALDLALNFTGLDMPLLSPYSGTYAGFAIERGLLNIDLKYSLGDNYLKGDNSIVIDKLKLGERVESDKALNVPLELGLALLTDLNGIIDLKVPVSGDIDDPEFSLGSVIVGAFVNLITKAVTAPFTLLAGLVSSEEDLQRVNFSVGSAELSENNQGKLTQLASALGQRPGLTLIIYGRLLPEADTQGLQESALEASLVAAGVPAQEVNGRGPQFIAAVEARYRQLPDAGTPDDPDFLTMHQQLVKTMPVSDGQLLDLATARSVAVKEFLVNQAGIPADRAVIEQTAVEDKDNQFSGVALDVSN